MSKCLIIHAPNINSGGGYNLFQALINELSEKSLLIVDKRLPMNDSELKPSDVIRVKPSILGRLKAEIMLYRRSKSEDTVICFGNLPPLLKLKAKTILFIQNRYLVDPNANNMKTSRLKIRIFIERNWLKFFHNNIDVVIVQTPTMKSLVLNTLLRDSLVLPFMRSEGAGYKKKYNYNDKKYDFIYVASGENHKNHYRLIDAWIELARTGNFPTLCLTISPSVYSTLYNDLQESILEYQLNINNVGEVTNREVMQLYQQSHALIYPSIMESFGLPLLEADRAGLKIIASELDYVRDVVQPVETFDPNSSISIMRAVGRLMHYENKKIPLLDARQFLNEVVNL